MSKTKGKGNVLWVILKTSKQHTKHIQFLESKQEDREELKLKVVNGILSQLQLIRMGRKLQELTKG